MRLALIVLVACGGNPGPDCARVIDAAAVTPRMKAAMAAACKADPWPAVVLDCIAAGGPIDPCLRKLSFETYTKLAPQLVEPSPPAPDAATPWVGPAPIDAGVPAVVPPPADVGCQTVIKDVRSRDCIRQYCNANPNDLKCQVE